jgi:hypothetical protein
MKNHLRLQMNAAHMQYLGRLRQNVAWKRITPPYMRQPN